MEIRDFLKQAAAVRPSPRQLAWFDTEFYAFVHFSPNTYTGLEWGTGKEDPAIFNPTKFDPDQWVAAVKSAGMRGLVLTAKHHDGFCLWPSKYTEHSVKNSPWQGGKGDIVKEVAEACRRGGLKFGFYLSPWDRNCPLYGSDAYNNYYKAQLTELLTGYGEIFHVWFDGACGEGPNGKRQVYDFDGYIELIRKYQPNATIFNDKGPDVRWIGNESGTARAAEWAVVPHELCGLSERQTDGPVLSGSLSYLYNTDPYIGTMPEILYSRGLCFAGAEVDMSIRPGWFYHPEEEPHSLERLFNTYLTSVGGNACFHLNIPPTPEGLFDERDVKRLKELGDKLHETFAADLAEQAEIVKETLDSDTQVAWVVRFPQPTAVRYLMLMEEISKGQRIERFKVQARNAFGNWEAIYHGTTVGHKRICPLDGEARGELRVLVASARDEVLLRRIALF